MNRLKDFKFSTDGILATPYHVMKNSPEIITQAREELLGTKVSPEQTLNDLLSGPTGLIMAQTKPTVFVFMGNTFYKAFANPTKADAKEVKSLAIETGYYPYVFGQTREYDWG